MTRTFSFLFLFLFLASCGKGGSGSAPGLDELTDAQIASETAPIQAQTFDINANLSGFERDHEDKIYSAFDLIKRVVASDEFKRRVLGHKWKGKKEFVDNGGHTNAEVYKKILNASEKLTPGKTIQWILTLKVIMKVQMSLVILCQVSAPSTLIKDTCPKEVSSPIKLR